ncbi:hypothetical protein KKC1_22270 [Calderihabitans maritimus]|uniref:Uncharacterized protein n=1 Tax=Calderihabitans maritimus TaxID=1246530 RepID=A0A1Z5HU77_9FIRM|nr:hypothetical protein KKC1_22270 [Calderihabitans maritimus]
MISTKDYYLLTSKKMIFIFIDVSYDRNYLNVIIKLLSSLRF